MKKEVGKMKSRFGLRGERKSKQWKEMKGKQIGLGKRRISRRGGKGRRAGERKIDMESRTIGKDVKMSRKTGRETEMEEKGEEREEAQKKKQRRRLGK